MTYEPLVFRQRMEDFVSMYLDDVIALQSMEEHTGHIKKVFLWLDS